MRLIEWFKSLFKPRLTFDPTARFISESGSFPVPWHFTVWGPASSENRNASISPNMTPSRFLWCVREAARRYPGALEIIRERLEDDLQVASRRLSVVRAFCEVADEVKKLRQVEAQVQYGRLMPGEVDRARENLHSEISRLLVPLWVPEIHFETLPTDLKLQVEGGLRTEGIVESFLRGGVSMSHLEDVLAREIDRYVLDPLLGTLEAAVRDLEAKLKTLTEYEEGGMP